MAEYVKPPLGVGPHWYVYRARIEDLNKAIERYLAYIETNQHTMETKQCYELIAEWAKEIEALALLEARLDGKPKEEVRDG